MMVAVVILAVAAWVLLHFVIHIVAFFAGVLVVVVAIVAVVWALRVPCREPEPRDGLWSSPRFGLAGHRRQEGQASSGCGS
jgi:hypothetical protein